MIVVADPKAIQKVLDTWSGNGPSIDQSPQFKRFGLTVDGPVRSIGYSDTAENTRHFAQSLDKAGAIGSMFVGMAAAKVDEPHPNPQLEVANEVLKLLPSLAKVIGKFDFLEGNLQVTQQGATPTRTSSTRSRLFAHRPQTKRRPPPRSPRIRPCRSPRFTNDPSIRINCCGKCRLIVNLTQIDYPFLLANLARRRLPRQVSPPSFSSSRI